MWTFTYSRIFIHMMDMPVRRVRTSI